MKPSSHAGGHLHHPTPSEPAAPAATRQHPGDHLCPSPEASCLYRLRALQLQAQRENRAALDHLNDLLRLSRHLRNKTITASFLLGLEVEGEALSGLEDWARGACDDVKLMRDALEALKTHESELPPGDDVLKADYLGAYPRLRDHYADKASPRGWDQPSAAGSVLLTRINTVFMLDAQYQPGPALTTWTGSVAA